MMKFPNVIKFILYQVIAIAILFVIFEGLSSTTLVIYNIWQNSRQLERELIRNMMRHWAG